MDPRRYTRTAIRGFQKVLEKCPACGSKKPKELVEGKSQPISIPALIVVLVIALFTCGLGLLLLPLIKPPREVVAYCADCDHSFPYGE